MTREQMMDFVPGRYVGYYGIKSLIVNHWISKDESNFGIVISSPQNADPKRSIRGASKPKEYLILDASDVLKLGDR
jgi:hypothetical protein